MSIHYQNVMANFLSRLVGGGSAVAPTSKTAPAVQSGSIAPVAGSGTEATRTDAAARMDAALHGQRERTVEGQPLFAQIVDSFPRHRIEQLQRKLGDLRPLRRAEQN